MLFVAICQKACHSSHSRAKFWPMTTPNLATNVSLDIRLLGNFPVIQIAGCRCILLAGNSSISLARRVEQINLSPKMLKMASESFIHALFVVFRSFPQNFPLGALT